MSNVIFKNNEQVFDMEVDAQFSFQRTNYGAHLNFQSMPVLASVPCGKCGKSTREIMRSNGIEIDGDDMKVNVAVISMDISNLINTDAMIEIEENQKIFKKINKHITEKMIGQLMCDGCCFTTEHIDNLLSE